MIKSCLGEAIRKAHASQQDLDYYCYCYLDYYCLGEAIQKARASQQDLEDGAVGPRQSAKNATESKTVKTPQNQNWLYL